MAPKEKVKRIMTPEQLERLAMARVKAGEARAAMKEDADGAKMAILQKKMDAIQGKKKPTAQPEPEPMEELVVSEPVSAAEMSQAANSGHHESPHIRPAVEAQNEHLRSWSG